MSAALVSMRIAQQTSSRPADADLRAYDTKLRLAASRFVRNTRGATMREIVHEGRVALWLASIGFVPVNGASLWAYAERAVLKAMIKYVTDRIAAIDLDAEEAALEIPHCVQPEGRYAAGEAVCRLGDEQRRVISLRLVGYTFEEIAEMLGRGKATIVRSYQSAIAELQQTLT